MLIGIVILPFIKYIMKDRIRGSTTSTSVCIGDALFAGMKRHSPWSASWRMGSDFGRQSAQQSGIMENGTMSRMLQLGDTQVDETKLADLCRRYRVRELSFFGSAARGEMRPDSDIDMLVEFLPDADIDLVDYAGLMLDLSHLLGRKVDLVSKNGLKPLIRASVLQEARLLYAA
jgi:predicted nucleotidyltransferase